MLSGNKVHIGCVKLLKTPCTIKTYIIPIALPLNKINFQTSGFTNV